MAKAMTLQRSASQPTTIDTIANSTTALGTTIPGMQTTSLFPARCVNLITVFNGDPYIVVLSAVGDIEIYRLVAGTWGLVAGPFTPPGGHTYTPLCMHVVNDTLVAMWTDVAGAGDGIRAAVSQDGTTWTSLITDGTAVVSSSLGGHSIVYRSAIWFATAEGLWAFAPLARIMGLIGVVGPGFQDGETITGGVSGTTATVRSFTGGSTLRVDDVAGSGFVLAEAVTGGISGTVGTINSITRFVNAAPDVGNDAGLAGPTGPSNLIGSFASWDGILYFLQPETAFGATKLYQLDAAWQATDDVPASQWTSLVFTGLPNVSFATLANDSGMWSLFVNRNDELCVFSSGATSTKLAKTTSKVFPLTFTDLTNTVLPAEISGKSDVGITLYADDRRRENNLHWFLIRDIVAGNTIITSWDGSNALVPQGTISGDDFILPASRQGEGSTFTNLEPGVSITSVTQPFAGRVRIDYVVRSNSSSPVDILPEYSIDGDEFFPMTEGDGDSGIEDLATSPAGTPYFFHWDAFTDLDGDFENMNVRIVARISGV